MYSAVYYSSMSIEGEDFPPEPEPQQEPESNDGQSGGEQQPSASGQPKPELPVIMSWADIAALPEDSPRAVRHTEEYDYAAVLLDALDDCDCDAQEQRSILTELHKTVIAMLEYVRTLQADLSGGKRYSSTPWREYHARLMGSDPNEQTPGPPNPEPPVVD